MKDRIQIDGEWYVKEPNVKEIILDVVSYEKCVVENDSFCYEAIRIKRDEDKSFYNSIDIKVTDKREKPWKEEIWDNNLYLKLILKNDSESLKSLNYNEDELLFLKTFLQYLVKENWLEYE
jgi:hypothetical protein